MHAGVRFASTVTMGWSRLVGSLTVKWTLSSLGYIYIYIYLVSACPSVPSYFGVYFTNIPALPFL